MGAARIDPATLHIITEQLKYDQVYDKPMSDLIFFGSHPDGRRRRGVYVGFDRSLRMGARIAKGVVSTYACKYCICQNHMMVACNFTFKSHLQDSAVANRSRGPQPCCRTQNFILARYGRPIFHSEFNLVWNSPEDEW
jgi:hypothetical protein